MNDDSAPSRAELPSAPRLRERLREETGRAILAAAEEVFTADGLHAARMERIAARAGVAVGTLYNHFEDRSALVSALCRVGRERLLARIDAALAAAADRPARAQLRAYLEAVVEHAQARGRFLSVLVQAGEGPARTRPTGSLLDDLLRRAEAVIARGVAAGELRPDADGIFAMAFVGVLRTVVARAVEGRAGWERLVDAMLEVFLEGTAR